MPEDEYDPESAFDLPPEELPESVDSAAVERMRLAARAMDDLWTIPGTDYRFGLDPLIGVLPVAGDAVAAAISLYIVAEAARLGVSYVTLLRMLGNVAVDSSGGSVPVVGTVFDTAWKANRRNVELALRDLLDRPGPAGDPDAERIEIRVED